MIVSWMTTNQCNLNCSHCYQDAGEKLGVELDTAEAKAMIESIAAAGFRIMIFSGGEPLLRPDIYELVAHAANAGLRPVFGTNGTLITPEVAAALGQAGAGAMGISLDSLDAAKHDAFRGCNGAFARTVAGMEHCRRAGLPFQVHTTVLDWNRPELSHLTDFAVEMGAAAHYLFFLVPTGRGEFIQQTALEASEYEQTLRDIIRTQTRVPIQLKPTCAPQFMRVAQQLGVPMPFQRGCLAGLTYCVVGHDGMVRPCAYMTEQAGDVRQRSFASIWRDSPLFLRLRAQNYGGHCGRCRYNTRCGGCRARAAYFHDGDIMAADSYCVYGREREGAI